MDEGVAGGAAGFGPKIFCTHCNILNLGSNPGHLILFIFAKIKFDPMKVQHREVQGNESKQMLSYFKKGLIYKEGGVASGFNHVIPNDYSEIQRLLWVRGKNPVRCTQVEMTWDSLNKSDCFILDLGNEIYVWCGPNSNPWERMSANEMGRSIRDDERAGKVKFNSHACGWSV